MATQITNYQCPACTGPLHFDAQSGKLSCDYCGSVFEVQEIEALYADNLQAAEAAGAAVNEQSAEGTWDFSQDGGWDDAGMKSYSCPSCGAELICDATTAATSCPYCGNPTVVPAQFHGLLRPDYILPFKQSKEDAIQALRGYYKGKPLLPRLFADNNHIEEVKGVYVPFWLFGGRVEADMTFNATRVHVHRHTNETVTETQHFQLHRVGTVDFDRIPADASSKMPDALMDAIEPFDYSEFQKFSTAYMPGFLAERYDMASDDVRERADKRAMSTASSMVAGTAGAGYSSCTVAGQKLRLSRGKVKYALLPVWMLSTRYAGKNYIFAMNGQTGKFIGDLPISKGRALAWFAGIAAPVAAAIAVALQFFG